LHDEDVRAGEYVTTKGDEPQIVIVPAAKGSEFEPKRVGQLKMRMESTTAGKMITKELQVITVPTESETPKAIDGL